MEMGKSEGFYTTYDLVRIAHRPDEGLQIAVGLFFRKNIQDPASARPGASWKYVQK